MWLWLAVLLALLTFGLKAYAEWSGYATVGAVGDLAVSGTLFAIGMQVKSVMDNTYIEDNDTGLTILLTIGTTCLFACGIGVYALYKLRESLTI